LAWHKFISDSLNISKRHVSEAIDILSAEHDSDGHMISRDSIATEKPKVNNPLLLRAVSGSCVNDNGVRNVPDIFVLNDNANSLYELEELANKIVKYSGGTYSVSKVFPNHSYTSEDDLFVGDDNISASKSKRQ